MESLSQRLEVPGLVVSDCVVRRPGEGRPERMYVLLHGFEQSGAHFFRKCQKALSLVDPQAAIVSPNAIYPLPRKVGDRYQVGFSWYFYDFSRDEYFIGMQPAIVFLRSLFEKLGLEGVPTTLIGFSQGGYLAPFAAQALPQVKRVIGIGCRFLHDELEGELPFRMDAIHGALDSIVPAEPSKASFEALQKRGIKGEFVLLPETEHRMDGPCREALERLLRER